MLEWAAGIGKQQLPAPTELAVNVAARQSDIPQVAVGELRGIALLARKLPPCAPKPDEYPEGKVKPRQGECGSGWPPRACQRVICDVDHDGFLLDE
jgi:hypothetical protein